MDAVDNAVDAIENAYYTGEIDAEEADYLMGLMDEYSDDDNFGGAVI